MVFLELFLQTVEKHFMVGHRNLLRLHQSVACRAPCAPPGRPEGDGPRGPRQPVQGGRVHEEHVMIRRFFKQLFLSSRAEIKFSDTNLSGHAGLPLQVPPFLPGTTSLQARRLDSLTTSSPGDQAAVGAGSPAGSWFPPEVTAGTSPPSRSGSSSSGGGAAVSGEKLTPVPALCGPLQRQSPAQGLPEKPQPEEPSRGRLPDCSPPAGGPVPSRCSWPHTSLWGLLPVVPAPTHPHTPQTPSPSLLTLGLGLHGFRLLVPTGAPCGLRFRQNPPGSGRIVGGQDATIGAWPWMVSLQVFTSHNNRRYHACGGTLLNSHWLLTAAHCFVSKKKVYDWRLIFGAREIVYGNDKPAKPPQQESYVEKIIIHEEYIPSLEHNDIALMKITPPVPCGQFIGMGCLPQFRADPPRFPPACWVIGWGFLKEK
ncbi:PREDICTED: coagulation factor XII-like, partial [Odobenus rosmarus divergens]|uniref:Coagulation factor XII-like n=1 Tax=Odobenus rosmarus divergens TaxID=9708 RepID=A0A9B0HBY3_ODORO